jgi:protein-S-isoprenylcysteine O-methyltransferase Ste14
MTLAPPGRSAAPSGTDAVPMMGDGTTVRSRTRTRWQRARWPLTVVVVALVVVLLSSLLTARTSTVPLAPDNPGPGGARALAEILRAQGVQIDDTRSVAQAVALADKGTTLLVTTTSPLFDEHIAALSDVEADLVLIAPVGYHLAQLTDDAVRTGGSATSGLAEAGCDDPDAQAAGAIETTDRTLVTSAPDVVLCFPTPGAAQTEGAERAGAYAVLTVRGRTVTVINEASLMTNAFLAEDGNAALLLRALGRHETLVWFVPTFSSASAGLDTGPGLTEILPPWATILGVQLLVVALALALWRGRRLGPVVTEPLPITVRAAETTLGRARLYRRARSWGHAGAALRAGTAQRCATRLGLPRSAGATDVIDALARATGRPTEQVAGLLYGPPPTDDAGLLQLARLLDELESEVHRT